MTDVIIIGKGPAGISAGLYLKRAGYDVLIIGKDAGALAKTHKIDNYYGMPSVSGKELTEKGIEQARLLGIEVLTDEVTAIKKESYFIVSTAKKSYSAKAVLLATGKSRQKLNVSGFERLRGKGISFCAVCDGFFYRNKKLAVIGNGDYAKSELSELMHFTKDITLFTDSKECRISNLPEDIKIVNGKVTEILGENKVTGIIADSREYLCDGIFVAIGTATALDFALKTGVFTDKNDIIVDSDYMTNVSGLFAAGDSIGGFLQISVAVSDGAKASQGIIKYLKNTKTEE